MAFGLFQVRIIIFNNSEERLMEMPRQIEDLDKRNFNFTFFVHKRTRLRLGAEEIFELCMENYNNVLGDFLIDFVEIYGQGFCLVPTLLPFEHG